MGLVKYIAFFDIFLFFIFERRLIFFFAFDTILVISSAFTRSLPNSILSFDKSASFITSSQYSGSSTSSATIHILLKNSFLNHARQATL